MRRVLPVTPGVPRRRARSSRVAGRRMVTPMLVVMVAIGSTDLLFALDSIPAIFGLTQEPYLVFTANAFALMGLRQLYFLLGGLLSTAGLPVLRPGGDPRLHRRQAGARGPAREQPAVPQRRRSRCRCRPSASLPSLSVIVGVLAITTVASLLKVRRDAAAARAPPGRGGRRARRAAGPPTPRRGVAPPGAPRPGQPGPVASLSGRRPLGALRRAAAGGAASTAPSRPSPASAVIQVYVGCRRRSVGEPGLSSRSVCRRPRRGGVPRDVAVPEHQHVDVRVRRRAPALPARGGAGLVDHGEPDAAQLHARDLGQPGPQRRPVVVAVHAHQPRGPRLQRVEQVDA